MKKSILLTGSAGHLGRHIAAALQTAGFRVVDFDLAAPVPADVRDRNAVLHAVARVDGVIHLAAVSRVARAESDPELCYATNVLGTKNVVDAALCSPTRPWILFVSSREVLGSTQLIEIATETSARAPCNVYGQTKAEAEQIVHHASAAGLTAAIIRLSNVYGSPTDLPERAIPSFVRSALAGRDLQVRGPERLFDFLHVDDAIHGLMLLVDRMDHGRTVPGLVHLVSGQSFALGEIAKQVVQLSESTSRIHRVPAVTNDVAGFRGSHALATECLGWRPTIDVKTGLCRLIDITRGLPQPQARMAAV